ncbi:hypothetical protein GC176_05145 [bacterium]|nr:hypothetical protein [bacterium]
MKVRNVLKSALAGLACFGTLIPQTCLNAADTVSEPSPPVAATSQQAKKIADIELDQQGRLLGVLVGSNSKPEALKKILVQQGKQTLAETKTDKDGRFQVSKLRGGIYQIVSEDQAAIVRVWSNGTAPPKAKTAVLLVTGDVTRGQGFVPLNMIGSGLGFFAGVAGLTLSLVTLNELHHVKDDNRALQDQVNRLENSLH